MSEGDGGAAEDGNQPADPDQCVLDAVICVHFVGAGAHRLLIKVLQAYGMVLLVPAEVAAEVAGKARKYPEIKNPWKKLTASKVVEVLPELDSSSPARLILLLQDIRTHQNEQLRQKRNLGEAAVIAHGAYLQEQGHTVFVAIDDHDAQVAAARHPKLTVLEMEDVLALAIDLGEFTTAGDLKKLYNRLRNYGQSLIPYEMTTLGQKFKDWKNNQI